MAGIYDSDGNYYNLGAEMVKKKTFKISARELSRLIPKNRTLASLLESGAFSFINNYVCLNIPILIDVDALGRQLMTELALDNIRNCCLEFNKLCPDEDVLLHNGAIGFINAGSVSFGFSIGDGANSSLEETISGTGYFVKEVAEIAKRMNGDLGANLAMLMECKNCKVEQLSEFSLISAHRISNLRNGGKNPKLSTLIAICIGLKLPPMLSYKLLDSAGYKLNPGIEEHLMYELLLSCCSTKTIFECNELLVGNKFLALGKNN